MTVDTGIPDSERLCLDDRVRGWLSSFEEVLEQQNYSCLSELFIRDSHWRDMGAFTWDLGAVSGLQTIENLMRASVGDVKPSTFELASKRSGPRRVTRNGRDVVEAFISFRTVAGCGAGVVRLVEDEGGLKAWVLLTQLEGIVGAERRRPGRAALDAAGSRSWKEMRQERSSYADRDPEVIVVGGGHHGLFSAVALQDLGVDVLVVDRFPRIGDNWRTRYASLALHNETDMVHFPGLPFPDSYPQFLPKDLLADWFELYVEAMQLNYWCSTEFVSGEYHEASRRWQVVIRLKDGTERTMRPRHIVMATGGVGGRPYRPNLPGIDSFNGSTLHSSEFRSGADHAGERVLVLGVGTSGHDTARELHLNGAQVAMLQRGPVTVVDLETSLLCYPPTYFDGTPLPEADFISKAGFIHPLVKEACIQLGKMSTDKDRQLLDALEKAGLRIREPENGWLWQLYETFSGYYLNVGCSELIISGDIPVYQAEDVETFTPDGLAFNGGRLEKFDTVVLATGYMNQQHETEELFGSAIADKVGLIGGLDATGELRNTYKPTPQRGLWFTSSGFAQGRQMAPHMAAMIRGDLDGHAPASRYGFISAIGGPYE